jgi:hypothetical protein
MSDDYEDLAASMSHGEIVRMLRYHDKDLYRGNGKPGITRRLDALEDCKDRMENDLYDRKEGLVPRMNDFFAVQDEREKRTTSRMTTYLGVMAAVAVAAPVAWDLMKHSFGWLAK